MTQLRYPSRRGAALLLVLATLILAVTASATLARVTSTVKLNHEFTHRTAIADDLLRAAQPPILTWLASKSSTVVLPPEATSSQVQVLHDAWVIDAIEHELRITAWDQCGMVPVDVARSGSPLRLVLPAEVKRVLDQVTIRSDQPAGLDWYLWACQMNERLRVFPEPSDPRPVIFEQAGGEDQKPPHQPLLDEPPAGLPDSVAVGEYIATHNPGRINVNTAPMEVVQAALRLAGRGGLEHIVAARLADRLTLLNDLPRIDESNRAAPRIATSSNTWAFRIDLRVGTVRRSWWAVYVQSRSTWECVQRLAIPE